MARLMGEINFSVRPGSKLALRIGYRAPCPRFPNPGIGFIPPSLADRKSQTRRQKTEARIQRCGLPASCRIEDGIRGKRDPPDLIPDATKPMADPAAQRLTTLRNGLLRLHKSLLHLERAAYERDVARIQGPGQLLDLVLNDPWFAWLRELSQFVVVVDETLDSE